MKKTMDSYTRRKKRSFSSVKSKNKNLRYILKINRTNKNFYAMIVDTIGNVVFSSSTLKSTFDNKFSGVEKAKLIGEIFAKSCVEKNIKMVAFDKGPYKYGGRVKNFADSCRENGLCF